MPNKPLDRGGSGPAPWLEKLARSVQEEVQFQSRNTLIIFDKTFFDTFDPAREQVDTGGEREEGEEDETGPLLVFLDKKGNQIKASRVDSSAPDALDISYTRCSTTYLSFWEDGVVGDKYKPDGYIGWQYYGPHATEWTSPPADEDTASQRPYTRRPF